MRVRVRVRVRLTDLLEGRAAGDAHLRLRDVDAGDLLGDGVLDLDARVHLDEVVPAVGLDEELDLLRVRARVRVRG